MFFSAGYIYTQLPMKQNRASADNIQRELQGNFHSDLRRRYLAPKVGSGFFAAINVYLLTQASSPTEHALFGTFFQGQSGYILLTDLLVISLFCFGIFRYREKREQRLADDLMSDRTLRSILKEIRTYGNKERLITTADIRRTLQYVSIGRNVLRILRPQLSAATIDQIVELQVARLLEGGILEQVSKRDSDQSFRLLATE